MGWPLKTSSLCSWRESEIISELFSSRISVGFTKIGILQARNSRTVAAFPCTAYGSSSDEKGSSFRRIGSSSWLWSIGRSLWVFLGRFDTRAIPLTWKLSGTCCLCNLRGAFSSCATLLVRVLVVPWVWIFRNWHGFSVSLHRVGPSRTVQYLWGNE